MPSKLEKSEAVEMAVLLYIARPNQQNGTKERIGTKIVYFQFHGLLFHFLCCTNSNFMISVPNDFLDEIVDYSYLEIGSHNNAI